VPEGKTNNGEKRFVSNNELVLVDVGARGGIDPRWRPFHDRLSVIAFEPEAEECARLRQRQYPYKIEFLPVALGARNNESATLYITRQPGCSSTLRPHAELCQRYEYGPQLEVVATQSITLQRMDSVLTTQPHMIKVDTQGTELHILQGAGRLLEGCLAVEAEVEFDQQYVDQPVFADVDAFMRSQGFRLQALKRSYWRLKGQHGSARGGKLMHGDALYFRAEIGESEQGRMILAAYRQDDLLAHYGAHHLIPQTSRWRTMLGRLAHHKQLRQFVDSLRPPTATDWHDPEFY
jgi:FkbM family methyltransferase